MSTLSRVVTLAAALALAGCSSTASGAGGGELALVSPGSLTLCTNPPYPPFEEKRGEEVVGLDIDVVTEIADDLGVGLVVVETGFDGIQSGAALDAGTCDLAASGITITEAREAKLDFSDPYFDANQALLVPAGSGIDSAAALAGVKVGVQMATTGEAYAKDQGWDTLQYEDTGLQVQALRIGDVGAIVNDALTLEEFADETLVIGTEFSTGEHYGIAVRTGNSALLAAVNSTLARIQSDGTYDAIHAVYFGASATS
ncbi:MAG TPA: transporter substrate-binding domain-containing protein [Actinotalea sp.]|nr:transporter substrate-binding domain-containing protein [Actinotalea sp.]